MDPVGVLVFFLFSIYCIYFLGHEVGRGNIEFSTKNGGIIKITEKGKEEMFQRKYKSPSLTSLKSRIVSCELFVVARMMEDPETKKLMTQFGNMCSGVSTMVSSGRIDNGELESSLVKPIEGFIADMKSVTFTSRNEFIKSSDARLKIMYDTYAEFEKRNNREIIYKTQAYRDLSS